MKRVLARCAVVVAVGLGVWIVWKGYELVQFGEALTGKPGEWVESRSEARGVHPLKVRALFGTDSTLVSSALRLTDFNKKQPRPPFLGAASRAQRVRDVDGMVQPLRMVPASPFAPGMPEPLPLPFMPPAPPAPGRPNKNVFAPSVTLPGPAQRRL